MNPKRTAFTLVELVMVIVIIGLLAAVVVPKFADVNTEAKAAAEEGTVAAIQSGISLAHMAELIKGNDTYPSKLDDAKVGDASATNALFTDVIDGGITDANWSKVDATTYKYKPTGNSFKYDSGTGKFTATK